MLPLGLLNAAQGHPMLVELKNGETLNGHLVNCDTWMNLTLKEVVQTNPEGTAFFRLPEVYVRGNNIKYLRVPDEIIDLVKEQQQNQPSSRDALWTALCPFFYSLSLLAVRYNPKPQKTTIQRCFCTKSKPEDSKVRFIRKNAPPWLGKRANAFKKDNNFFSSDQNTTIAAHNPVVEPPDSSIEHQDRSEKQTWHSLSGKVSEKWNHQLPSLRKSVTEYDALQPEDFPSKVTPELHNQLVTKPGPSNPILRWQYQNSITSGFRVRRKRGIVELNDEELYDELRRASSTGDYPRIREVLRILIRERGVQPDRRHYQALLLANANPQHGSPVEVTRIIEEMEDSAITLDSAAYHAILKVLAVHPDYILRRQILEELRQRWFTLSNEGWHDVIVGLLRDKQLESAVETLQSVQQEGIRIPSWLYDMLIFNLCDVGEHEEALSILRFRVENGEHLISGTVWHYLLDSASRAYHHQATLFAWRKRVGTNYLNPSSGVCLNVLDTAARHGDFRLATDVIRVLGNRGQGLKLYHYETLIEACVPSELRTAFTLLALMITAGIPPTVSSTRPIFLHLRQSAQLPDAALSMLRQVAKQQRAMPAEAVNVIIEAYIYHGNFEQALDAYKTLHTICGSGPVTSTFNTLFRGCHSRKDTAMFLASEMVALKIAPDALTYDRLILVCLEGRSGQEDFEDAWRYFEEMRGIGWWPRPGTTMALAKQCCLMGDERIWGLQGDDYGEDGITISAIQRLIDGHWTEKGIQRRTESKDS
ncbi:MAG: hypothetical protein L6R38_000187 [Xanthoria sp. 2 TBL-2021]|nr:MAG: hypothetical protein L6R38_000187 [Xanthoria sp. 2 TBL-2021]